MCNLNLQNSVSEIDGKVCVDDNESGLMELNAGCVVAYSVYELRVNVIDGTFEIILGQDNKGGFCGEDKVDSPISRKYLIQKGKRVCLLKLKPPDTIIHKKLKIPLLSLHPD